VLGFTVRGRRHERHDGFHLRPRGIGNQLWFVTSDSRSRHVRDNEMNLRLSHQFHRHTYK
jgi:hypothetical protein